MKWTASTAGEIAVSSRAPYARSEEAERESGRGVYTAADATTMERKKECSNDEMQMEQGQQGQIPVLLEK
jgi:hypothetical protein